MGRNKIVEEIRKMAARALEGRYGIELVDVRIKYINYVEAVIPKIYDRMRSNVSVLPTSTNQRDGGKRPKSWVL